ncbi:MAG: pantetheine-phosphate adenylyltransferase [Candidatus Shapirobacteria bacterium]|nr:pantetheine-phosphate adenylyltransferase [Candidatus Shapirobacteria bacterium]
MTEERIGIYAGSFDPPTNGHLWMIKQGAKLFDKLIVAVGINSDKKYTFTTKERLSMLQDSVKDCPNVVFDDFSNQFLVNYAQKIKAKFILRGSRSSSDFIFEQAMNNINQDINSSITTVLLLPPRNLCEVSSSFVKNLIGSDGWEDIVSKYVPQPVLNQLKQKYSGK